jgi:hypothetical protein
MKTAQIASVPYVLDRPGSQVDRHDTEDGRLGYKEAESTDGDRIRTAYL